MSTGFTGVEAVTRDARVLACVEVDGAGYSHRVVNGILEDTLRQLIVDGLIVLLPGDLEVLHLVRVRRTCTRELGLHALGNHHVQWSSHNPRLSYSQHSHALLPPHKAVLNHSHYNTIILYTEQCSITLTTTLSYCLLTSLQLQVCWHYSCCTAGLSNQSQHQGTEP